MVAETRTAFIFDMDGTLVDNMQFHARAWIDFLAGIGIELNPEDFRVNTAGKTSREILRGLLGPTPSDARLDELGYAKDELYRAAFREHLRPLSGTERFLQSALDQGISLAVATASTRLNVEYILDGLDLRKYFGAVVTADHITHGKPHPEIFESCARLLEATPARCIVFEDALNGFEAARRAGMRAIGVTTVNSREVLLALPSVVEVVDNFENLDAGELVRQYLS